MKIRTHHSCKYGFDSWGKGVIPPLNKWSCRIVQNLNVKFEKFCPEYLEKNFSKYFCSYFGQCNNIWTFLTFSTPCPPASNMPDVETILITELPPDNILSNSNIFKIKFFCNSDSLIWNLSQISLKSFKMISKRIFLMI